MEEKKLYYGSFDSEELYEEYKKDQKEKKMQVLKDLMQSKKFLGLLTGLVLTIAGRLLGLELQDLAPPVILLVSYIVGQGIADNGKEKAKIEKEESNG